MWIGSFPMAFMMQDACGQRVSAAITLQAHARARAARAVVHAVRAAVTRVQAHCRGALVRRRLGRRAVFLRQALALRSALNTPVAVLFAMPDDENSAASSPPTHRAPSAQCSRSPSMCARAQLQDARQHTPRAISPSVHAQHQDARRRSVRREGATSTSRSRCAWSSWLVENGARAGASTWQLNWRLAQLNAAIDSEAKKK